MYSSIEPQNIAAKASIDNTRAFNNQFDTENQDVIFSDLLTIDEGCNDEINFRGNINSEDYNSLSKQSNFSIPELKKKEDESLSVELVAMLAEHTSIQQEPVYKADKLDVTTNTHNTELFPLDEFKHNDDDDKYYDFLKQNITVKHVESKSSNNDMAQIVSNYDFEQAGMDTTSIDNNTDIISNAVVTNNGDFSDNTEEDDTSNNDFSGEGADSSNSLTDNIFSLDNNHLKLDNKVSGNKPNISVFDNDFIEKFNNLQPEITIEKIVKSDDNFIIVKLNPEELGEVTFTIDMKDNIPQKIEAISESKDTLALIEKYATELKDSLFKIGVGNEVAMEFNLGNNNKQHNKQFQQTLDNTTFEDDNIILTIENYNIYQQPQHSSQINLIV